LTGKTHILGGMAAAMAISQTMHHDPVLLSFAGAIGGLLPDICHSGSKIGRKFSLISRMINKMFGHRTFTHSLLFLIIINGLFLLFLPFEAIRIGILIGMSSHLLLDAATKQGIKLLYPLDVTIRFPISVKTGGAFESIVFVALSVVILYYGKDVLFYYL
jgi:inner membrane protein